MIIILILFLAEAFLGGKIDCLTLDSSVDGLSSLSSLNLSFEFQCLIPVLQGQL